MALSQTQRILLATDKTFRNLVALALADYADNVLVEAQGGRSAGEHNARRALASQVIRDAVGVADRYVWFLAQQAEGLTWNMQTYPTAAEFALSVGEAAYENFVQVNWTMLCGWFAPTAEV